MSQVLHMWNRPPESGVLEIRVTKAPPNPHRWVFMWAVLEVLGDGKVKILTGTGQHGNPGSLTLDEALTAAGRAYEQMAIDIERRTA